MIFWSIFDQALFLYFERSFCCYYLGQQHGVSSQRIGQSASISTGCRVSKSLATSNEHECGGNFCRCRHLRNPDPVWCSFSTFPCWPPSCLLPFVPPSMQRQTQIKRLVSQRQRSKNLIQNTSKSSSSSSSSHHI